MPIYEYACKKCNKRFEVMQKITDESLTTCTDCKGHLKKIMSNTSFVLKGTGWYATDYASGKSSSTKTSSPEKKKDSTTTTTTTPAETTASAKEPAVSEK